MTYLLFEGFWQTAGEVALSLFPLILFFLFFRVFFLDIPREQVLNIIKGAIIAFWGFTLFLQGVRASFFPTGELIGARLGTLSNNWLMVPIGFLLGFVATFAEPAVRILNLEVEKVSSGYIPRKIMLYTLCTGVAVSIALSMLRILTGWPLIYFILPGYVLALLLMRYSGPLFTAIAFDAGGVTTGPMTVTFILAIAVGAATAMEGRDPLLDGFGMISLVALTPILSVLILGLLFKRKKESQADS